MSESKSDALTNLATPLHGSAFKRPTLTVSLQPTQPAGDAPDFGTFCLPIPPEDPPVVSPWAGCPCLQPLFPLFQSRVRFFLLLQTPRCRSLSFGCCRNGLQAAWRLAPPRHCELLRGAANRCGHNPLRARRF